MAKEIVHIPPVVAQMIALCYQGMQSALVYAREIAADPNAHHMVQTDFTAVAASLRQPLERIDRRIPRSTYENFLYQVKDNDPIRLDNIRSLYMRMTPEQQELLETVAGAILTKEFTIEGV